MNRIRWRMIMAAALLGAGLGVAGADTLTWTGMTGDWAVVDNWTNVASPENTRVPAEGDDAVIDQAGAYVALTNASAFLGSLTLGGASLVMSNWDTLLSATNVTIASGGVLTCEGPFTNNAVSNRVNLLCSNLLVETGGTIDVSGKGWAGGLTLVLNAYQKGNGPGARGYYYGASYGGAGRNGQSPGYLTPTNTYGVAEAPLDPGSGGHAGNNIGSMGGSGGGAVRIVADSVVVSGIIRANGSATIPSSHCSAGSGGGIFVTCTTIAGTNGVIEANAGDPLIGHLGGGGGGGRVAVIYNPAEQAVLPVPAIRFSAASSMSGGQYTRLPGDIGTLYFPDSLFFSATNLFTGQWLAPGLSTNIALSEWTVSNVWTRLPGMSITVTNALKIVGTNSLLARLDLTNASSVACDELTLDGATLVVGRMIYEYGTRDFNPLPPDSEGSTLDCAGDLVLANQARLYVYADLTHPELASDYGARVSAGGDVSLGSNCWIYPVAHPTNGASVLFTMQNLTITNAGGFNANTFGFAGGTPWGYPETFSNRAYGPGAPGFSHGAGYGGWGSTGYLGTAAGQPYGSANAPTAPGSGARAGYEPNAYGPYGGGSVQIRASDTVAFSGLITANGGPGAAPNGGGSSGGGIYITCNTFIGDSNAVLRADGGMGSGTGGGGGSGGRIAVWRINDLSPSVVSASVSGAVGRSGTVYQATSDPGTIVWGWLPSAGTVIRFR